MAPRRSCSDLDRPQEGLTPPGVYPVRSFIDPSVVRYARMLPCGHWTFTRHSPKTAAYEKMHGRQDVVVLNEETS